MSRTSEIRDRGVNFFSQQNVQGAGVGKIGYVCKKHSQLEIEYAFKRDILNFHSGMFVIYLYLGRKSQSRSQAHRIHCSAIYFSQTISYSRIWTQARSILVSLHTKFYMQLGHSKSKSRKGVNWVPCSPCAALTFELKT